MTFNTDTIRDASTRLRGLIVRTPLLEVPQLNELAGARVLVKAESLQLTGSFKVRGALNTALRLSADARSRGLVAFSAGNHGQGVAAAARTLDVPAVIVMPNTAPAVKVDNCRWWGAEVVLYDPSVEDRELIAGTFVIERGMALVPPFDHDDVMSGQGTVGLEIAEDLTERGIVPDDIVVAGSGGGLAAGVATAVTVRYPHIAVHIVEPAGRGKLAAALAGTTMPVAARELPTTVLDALAGPTVGSRALSVLSGLPVTTHEVTDEEALDAIAVAFRNLRIVLEPGGAAPLATVLQNPGRFSGRTVVVVASGGNIDPALFARAIG